MLKYIIRIIFLTIFLIVIVRTVVSLPLKLRSQTLPPSTVPSPPMTSVPSADAPLSTTGVNSHPINSAPNFNASPKNPTHQLPPENIHPTSTNADIPVTHVPLSTTPVNPNNPVALPRNIAPLSGMPNPFGNNLLGQNIVPFMYKRSNIAYRAPYNAYNIPYNIHKRGIVPNLGMVFHNPPLYRRNNPFIPIPIIGNERRGAWF
ncbi:4773_t:CDS:1 [Cetraspora pellucida]|uniref:4773_t:CDS:1 n=1 Tax=Cetraspora pellucida TaxID=1433469 RepID=A0A9N9JE29_9GLOM|nr:4773_t:CDS:1 [Cetraspora pellucida]